MYETKIRKKAAEEKTEFDTEMLMTQAAEQGVPVEELFEQMLRNYLERRECNAD